MLLWYNRRRQVSRQDSHGGKKSFSYIICRSALVGKYFLNSLVWFLRVIFMIFFAVFVFYSSAQMSFLRLLVRDLAKYCYFHRPSTLNTKRWIFMVFSFCHNFRELSCPLHRWEGFWLQGQRIPPCDPQLHVPGRWLYPWQWNWWKIHLRREVRLPNNMQSLSGNTGAFEGVVDRLYAKQLEICVKSRACFPLTWG